MPPGSTPRTAATRALRFSPPNANTCHGSPSVPGATPPVEGRRGDPGHGHGRTGRRRRPRPEALHRLSLPTDRSVTAPPSAPVQARWLSSQPAGPSWQHLAGRAATAGAPWAGALREVVPTLVDVSSVCADLTAEPVILSKHRLLPMDLRPGPDGSWVILNWDHVGPIPPRQELGASLAECDKDDDPAVLGAFLDGYRSAGFVVPGLDRPCSPPPSRPRSTGPPPALILPSAVRTGNDVIWPTAKCPCSWANHRPGTASSASSTRWRDGCTAALSSQTHTPCHLFQRLPAVRARNHPARNDVPLPALRATRSDPRPAEAASR